MSRYVCYYSARKGFYRELATKWMKWAATTELTETELAGITAFFKQIATRFGLISEFRELGIL